MTRPPSFSFSTVHIPVMRDDVIGALRPTAGETYIDATFGAGGYTTALLNACSDTHVIAFDRDPDAHERFKAMPENLRARMTFIDSPFSAMDAPANISAYPNGVDGVMFDLGVSSPQIDTAERGFSFRLNGPLDMRMDPRCGQSAADLVNTLSERELADLIYLYGEERKSRSIARAIIEERKTVGPITTTENLATVIRRVIRPSPKDTTDPCTRTFQALRIAVNRELDELKNGLRSAISVLKPNGRLIVVSFHSLEDRIVKQIFIKLSGLGANPSRHAPNVLTIDPTPKGLPLLHLMMRQAVLASESETHENPRARSAKMRVAIRTNTPLPVNFNKNNLEEWS